MDTGTAGTGTDFHTGTGHLGQFRYKTKIATGHFGKFDSTLVPVLDTSDSSVH